MPSQRILITGATGFVGRHLVAHFLSAMRPLTLAVRKAEECPVNWHSQEQIRIVETGAIEDSTLLENALSDVTTVVHAAGLTQVNTPSASEPDTQFLRANVKATETLAQAVLRSGARQFINISSLHAVTSNSSPIVVSDETENEPSTSYGKSKRLAERFVLDIANSGVFAISLRPPLIVGADASGNWRALQRIAATGLPLPFASIHNKRSMIGIDTIVHMISHLCSKERPRDKSGNYCIADPEVVSLRTIVEELRRGMNIPPRLFPVPTSLLYSAARFAQRRLQAEGLFGNLEVDGSRFCQTFDVVSTCQLREAIRKSGSLYVVTPG